MKELYGHELPFWMKWLGIWRVNSDSFDFWWGYFAPRCGFALILNRGGYFDQHYYIRFCLIWGEFYIKLPLKTRIEESCDTPAYGIQIHSNTFWIRLGGPMVDGQCDSKWITWEIPGFAWVFDSLVVWDGIHWVLPTKGEYRPPFTDGRLIEVHPYKYTLKSGETQLRTARIYKEQRAWHRKWIPLYQRISTTLSVDFSDEVGEKTGSWKGGTIGCGYEIIEGETMLDALRRMEKERKF